MFPGTCCTCASNTRYTRGFMSRIIVCHFKNTKEERKEEEEAFLYITNGKCGDLNSGQHV